MNFIKEKLLDNKNDLVKGTFCYLLFEEGIFENILLSKLIDNAKNYLNIEKDDDIKKLLDWIVICVNQCFISHHDKDDFFIVKNYTVEIESQWNENWKPELERLILG